MSDQFSVPVALPLDADGFLRRECPSCEHQFKWFSSVESGRDTDVVEQYFCPLCGVPASTDAWWTPAQLEYARGIAAPTMDRLVQDQMKTAFKRAKGLSFKPNGNF